MSLRWELAPEQPDGLRSYWYLLDGDDALALLGVQYPVGQLEESALRPTAWERVRIGPDGQGWLIAGATLEPLPDVDDWRLSGLQPPPLHDGPLSLTFPPLP